MPLEVLQLKIQVLQLESVVCIDSTHGPLDEGGVLSMPRGYTVTGLSNCFGLS
jgi:hypothetical protein